MKKVLCYKVIVSVHYMDDSDNSRIVTFMDRRKALSYCKVAVDYWSPFDCCESAQSVESVKVTLFEMYVDYLVTTLFSKELTF